MDAVPIARLGHARATRTWALDGPGHHLRFHRYGQVRPSPGVGDMLRGIDRDPVAIMWDSPYGLRPSGAVSYLAVAVPLPTWVCPALGSLGYEGGPRSHELPPGYGRGPAEMTLARPPFLLPTAVSPHRHSWPIRIFFELGHLPEPRYGIEP